MTDPLSDVTRNERVIIEELKAREALGIDDTVEPVDMSEVEVPAPGVRYGDSRSSRYFRTGKRWGEIISRVEAGEYTWEEFAAALHPRELARGQLFDSRGGFSGRPPKMVPRAFYDACIRELMKRGRRLYQENYIQAVDAMTQIATDASVKPADRIKAAQFVIERLEGKVPERVEVVQAAPWEELIAGVVAEVAEDQAIANAADYLDRAVNE